MKVLIFGITGMLGHVVWETFKNDMDVYGTVRAKNIFKDSNVIEKIDVLNKKTVQKVIDEVVPDVIVNCIGIIKQLKEIDDTVLSVYINSLFPHMLAQICKIKNIRLIHISTDCVFSGGKGNYKEDDFADTDDFYGRTKYIGEVFGHNCLTIRTSLIGPELRNKKSLLEWFLAQQGQCKGYKKAIFSGLTTVAFSKILKDIIINYPGINGIYNIASNPISKYDLLVKLKDIYQKNIEIIPDEIFSIDRSLNSGKFLKDTSINIPNWDEMLADLRNLELVNI